MATPSHARHSWLMLWLLSLLATCYCCPPRTVNVSVRWWTRLILDIRFPVGSTSPASCFLQRSPKHNRTFSWNCKRHAKSLLWLIYAVAEQFDRTTEHVSCLRHALQLVIKDANNKCWSRLLPYCSMYTNQSMLQSCLRVTNVSKHVDNWLHYTWSKCLYMYCKYFNKNGYFKLFWEHSQ